ncbi:MAG: Trk system potassium transporter TrkA [Lachnospiraceae bacterium]|nr:Trk system potassium transporter TrkA [Lachnospiraceae bacterium]
MGLFKHTESQKPALKIVIVGSGNVGTTLVEQLTREGNDVALIDKNAKKVAELSNLYDVMGVVGNGATYTVQKEAGVDDADLFIAVTDSDELNLLCCTVAKHSGKCAAIARVRTPDYSAEIDFLKSQLGLAMIINPDLEMARETARLFYMPDALEVNAFAHETADLIKFKVPKNNVMDHVTIADFAKHDNANILICAVERNGEVSIPNGDFMIEAGDTVSFITPRKRKREFLKLLDFDTTPVKDCLMVGGGRSSYYLSRILINMGIKVKIIELDQDRCDQLSVLLPNAIIINGDGTDEKLLKEAGIETVDSFVSLTNIDETNIFLTMHANQISNAKVITKIKRMNFKSIINGMDLGSVIYPRYITAEAIVAYARAKRASLSSEVETMYHMYDNRVEAIEFSVDGKSPVTDTPIRKLILKDHVMLSFINRHGQIILPTGDDQIKVGDTVMVVTTHFGFNNLTDILA